MPRPTLGNLNDRKLLPTFLRKWRKKLGYTLEQAAEMIGIDHGTLSRVERGLVPYNQPVLEAIAEAYGVEATDLLSVDPTRPEETDIVRLFRRAGPELRQAAQRVLRTGAED